MGWLRIWDTLRQDTQWTWRTWTRSPAFSISALLTLTLGLGAATALFSVCDRLLFRPLPYYDADRLVSVGLTAPLDTSEFILRPDYVHLWKETPPPFDSVTAVGAGTPACDLLEQNPVRLTCAYVEPNLLGTLGRSVIAGRDLAGEDGKAGAPRTALITHALWLRRFQADPHVIGKVVNLDGNATHVVGILPADFELPTLAQADILMPQQFRGTAEIQTIQFLRTFARLKPGITEKAAFNELQPLFGQMLNSVPPAFRSEVRLRIRSLRERQFGDVRKTAWLLLAAVGALLLIACTNVANLLLARSAARRRELAIRAALGAGRRRLARLALTESLYLAAIASVAGLAIAALLLKAFLALAPDSIPQLHQTTLDGRAIAASIALAFIAALITGIAPALTAPKPEHLHGARTGNTIRPWARLSFLVAQLALTFALLGTSGLLLRSLWAVQSQQLGFDPQHVVAATVTLSATRYPTPESQASFFERLLQSASTIPGVASAGLTDSLPPAGNMRSMIFAAIDVAGRPRNDGPTGGMVAWRQVTPGYFEALGIPILRGRNFVSEDRTAGEPAMIVSQALARKLFPNQEPLGQRVGPGRGAGPWYTVVGIAADARNAGLIVASDPEYYVIRTMSPRDASRRSSVVIRTEMSPTLASSYLRDAIASLDRELPVDITSMTMRVSQLAARPRFLAVLLTAFGVLAVLIAGAGLAGVTGYLVTERTREIGVRLAVGATPVRIAREVLRETAIWCLAGLVLGIGLVAASQRVLASVLYTVAASDKIAWSAAICILVMVSLLAALRPAMRAARTDPMSALRTE